MKGKNRKDRRPVEFLEQVIQDVEIPKGAKLLEDACILEFKPEDLHEGEDGKRPYLKGRFGWVDKATANKRLYPRVVMAREIGRLSEAMKGKQVFGELDHPSSGKTELARVSHFVTGVEINEEGEMIGTIEFIPGTINGDQALAIARSGGKLGVSSRGFGSVAPSHKGEDVVQEDYRLVTWDIVADPANAGAHPNFVVENKEPGMDMDRLKEENPELVEQITADVRKKIEADAREHARDALREEFTERLRQEAEDLKEEAVAKARGELLEDPEVAGSANAIDRIKEIVSPFIFSEDENREMAILRERLSEAHAKIAELDDHIREQDAENQELSEIAKELGFHLHLERELAGNDRADQIMEMLGDVNEYENLDDLKGRFDEISEALSVEDEAKNQYESRIKELESMIVKLSEERNQALNIGQNFGIRAYVERKIADHPHRSKLRTFLNENRLTSKEDVDRLVETFTAANPVSDEYARIRSGIKGAKSGQRRGLQLTEDIGGFSSMNEEDDNLVGGVSVRELARLANSLR